MTRAVIIYASVHHHNTKKVADYVAAAIHADTVDILKTPEPDIGGYDLVIFASGIYFNRIHKTLQNYLDRTSFQGKQTALLYTCGMHYMEFAKPIEKMMKEQGADYKGSCYCRGYDTFGALKMIGGIAKKHPNQKDLDKVLKAVKGFCGE